MRHAAVALLCAFLAASTPAGAVRQNAPEWKRSISGRIVVPPGMAGAELRLSTIRTDVDHGDSFAFSQWPVDPDGSFVVPRLDPGSYGLKVEATRGRGPVRGAAVTIVDVSAKSVSGVVLQIQPPATVSGRIILDGLNPPRGGDVTVSLAAVGPAYYLYRLSPSIAKPGKPLMPFSFEADDLIGPRRLVVNAPDGWILESAILNDRTDITDKTFTVEPGKHYSDVRVTLTDRCATIVAEVAVPRDWDARGGVVVTAFPEDRDKRDAFSRFVRTESSPRDGVFEIKDLPPGETYLVAAHRWGLWVDETEMLEMEKTAPRVYVDRPGVFRVKLVATPSSPEKESPFLRASVLTSDKR